MCPCPTDNYLLSIICICVMIILSINSCRYHLDILIKLFRIISEVIISNSYNMSPFYTILHLPICLKPMKICVGRTVISQPNSIIKVIDVPFLYIKVRELLNYRKYPFDCKSRSYDEFGYFDFKLKQCK